jgi:hypothetical protein
VVDLQAAAGIVVDVALPNHFAVVVHHDADKLLLAALDVVDTIGEAWVVLCIL